MARNSILVNGTPSDVFDVLLDAHTYPRWVVGARKIRRVEDGWPAPGSAFHHEMGGAIRDKTQVLRLEEGKEILLEAYARPLGIARVLIQVEPVNGTSRITITEFPAPGSRMERLRPLLDPIIHARNVESLRRLRNLVEGGRAGRRSHSRRVETASS